MSNKNNNTLGYKKTILGLLPNEWEVQQFDTVFELLSTNSFSRENLSDIGTENDIQNIHYGDIHSKFENEILDCASEKLPYIKDEVIINQKFNFIQEGDLIIADASEDYAGIGECVEAINVGEKKIVSGLHTFLARDNSGLTIQGFRTYLFSNSKVNIELKKIATGISVYSISKGNLQKFKLVIPSVPEQRKIAAILSTWDEAITKTQQLIAQLQQRNKGLMQQLLKSKRGWKEVKLSDVFERVTQKNIEGNKNVVTISAQRGFVKQDDYFNKIIASDITDNYFLVHRGEFCYNKSYSKGYDWGATKRLNDFDKAVVTSLYICFRLKDENKYSGNYFEYFFNANILDKGLSKIAHEGGRAHGLLNVTPTDFFSLKINVPPFDEQLKIEKVLTQAKKELDIYKQQLNNLQQQKKGLMQKLLTGEVRVN